MTAHSIDDKSKVGLRCFNSGLPHLVEVADPLSWPKEGESLRAGVDDVLYREELRLRVHEARLAAALTVQLKGFSRQLGSGTVLRRHLIGRDQMYCWFDIKPFTAEELARMRIRFSPIGPPPFETVCLKDNDADGDFDSGIVSERGSIRRTKFAANVSYDRGERLVIPLWPDGGVGLPEAGQPFSQSATLAYLDNRGARIAFTRPSEQPDEHWFAFGDVPSERTIRGLTIRVQAAGAGDILYSVSGRFDEWAEIRAD
jgi:hypothetical protein